MLKIIGLSDRSIINNNLQNLGFFIYSALIAVKDMNIDCKYIRTSITNE